MNPLPIRTAEADETTLSTDPHPLPATRIDTAEGALEVRRAWPAPRTDSHTLAVELDDGERIRGGWFAHGRLELLHWGQDPKLAALPETAAEGAVVSHRPAKRAVVLSADGHRYTKVVKSGKASGILHGLSRAAAFTGPFRTPEVLASTDSTVTFAALEGQSLHHADAFSPHQWTSAWAAVLESWVQAVSDSQSAAASPAAKTALVHRAEAESGVLRHWHQLVAPWLEDAEAASRSVDHLSALLARLPEEQLRPAHRDLHDKQLLWSAESGPGLLDVDTACLADPALDLGNLRAHATLRRRQGVWTAAQAETVSFCVDEAAQQVATPLPTVAVYEQAALLRLGLVYAVRPQYAPLAAALRAMLRV